MKRKAIIILLISLVYAISAMAQDMNPYEILNNYYDAIGGLDKVKAEENFHFEGIIKIVGAGIEGIVDYWEISPNKIYQEIDLKVMKFTTGDNGNFSWIVDQNGKLQIQRDENTLNSRIIDELNAKFEFLDPESEYFQLKYEGIENIEGKDCYCIRTTNSINEDTIYEYYDIENYLLIKSIDVERSGESYTMFKEYKEVNGVLHPFLEETTDKITNEQQILQITLFETNIEVDESLFEPQEEESEDFIFENGKNVENISFEYYGEHLFIKVKINGVEKDWLLDTGASASVIFGDYAEELGLDLEGNLTGRGAGNTVEFSITTLPPFDIEGVHFEQQSIVCIPNLDILKRAMDREVAGILGYDFLSRFIIKVDYANELISLYHPDNFSYTGNGVIVDAPLDGNTFSLPMTINDKYTGNWSVDLGAGGLSFHYPYARDNNFHDLDGVLGVSFGAGGKIYDKSIMFDNIKIADFVIENQIIDIPMEEVSGAFGDRDQVGNLGNVLLKHFILYLDYENQRMIFEKGDDFRKEFPHGKSGFSSWRLEDNSIEIFFISPNTPAEDAGFEVGDIILSINGNSVDNYENILEMRELFKAEVGTEYIIKIDRDGDIKDIKLILKDLY